MTSANIASNNARMAGKLTVTIGFRAEPELKELIEREAESVGLRPGDFLRRKVEHLFSFASDANKTSKLAQETVLDWSSVDDDETD